LYEIKAKASDEPFDIDKLAFICAHPAFFRKLVFCAMEHENSNFRSKHGITSGGGYGRVDNNSDFLESEYNLLPDYNPMLFRTPEGSKKWIKENAKRVGIEIE
jgi:hypothetical protein